MLGVIHGFAAWPGVQSFLGCTYTLSHGLTPGVCILRCAPQLATIVEYGDLLISDGQEAVLLPDCKVQGMNIERDDRGIYWVLQIVDRRWRWKQFGWINGCYNQFAPVGQLRLIPWTIRSPKELATLCLTALGETSFTLQLPEGIDYPGPFFPDPIVNTSGVNPPVNWGGVPPAQALQQVADRCGCRIIYRWRTNDVYVGPIGEGTPLPLGSIAKRLPSITPPMAPSGVGVIGAPTRYQTRLSLTAVGEEWDGSYWPINMLSYTPDIAASPQVVQVSVSKPGGDIIWHVEIYNIDGVKLGAAYYTGTIDDNVLMVVSALAGQLAIEGYEISTAAGDSFTITGPISVPFTVEVSVELLLDPWPIVRFRPQIHAETLKAAEVARRGWDYSFPPLFPNVRATNQLTKVDAQRLARNSVFRCYQLTGVDVSGDGPPNIPGYGPVLRTWQIRLDRTQVDQITPQPQDFDVLISSPEVMPPDAPNLENVRIPLTVNFYNGFAHDKPAAVYGTIAYELVWNHIWYPQLITEEKLNAVAKGVIDKERLLNTPLGSQVMLPFETIPDYFMIRFGQPVYQRNGATKNGTTVVPNLVLQTAVTVRDPLNNQEVAFTQIRELQGGDPATPPLMRHYPDVQANVTSEYDLQNRIVKWTLLEDDPVLRAKYYLDGMQNEFQYKRGPTVEYNGIRSLDVDGLNWQITWNIDESGCSTTVSQNSEHSIWFPSYPARRRAEYLPPVTAVDKNGVRVNMARGFQWGPGHGGG